MSITTTPTIKPKANTNEQICKNNTQHRYSNDEGDKLFPTQESTFV